MRLEQLRLVAENPDAQQALGRARELSDGELRELLIYSAGLVWGSGQMRTSMAVLVAAERLFPEDGERR